MRYAFKRHQGSKATLALRCAHHPRLPQVLRLKIRVSGVRRGIKSDSGTFLVEFARSGVGIDT